MGSPLLRIFKIFMFCRISPCLTLAKTTTGVARGCLLSRCNDQNGFDDETK